MIFKYGVPYSERFEDVYFNRNEGLSESRYVFLEGSNTPDRWGGRDVFVIGETGFGTGLNFLASWHSWRNTHCRPQRLHFVSVEKHPLSRDDLIRCQQCFPELEALYRCLIEQYPLDPSGFHRLFFDEGDVVLTLCFGDVERVLSDLRVTVDSWFMDGFSPTKNPEMWAPSVCSRIAALSAKNTVLSTFTAAGQVRRNLESAGFKVRKEAGFGSKREMIVAEFREDSTSEKTPWFSWPSCGRKFQSAIVIGAGIGGCQIAARLAKRGLQTTVIERNAAVASEASGNYHAVISPKISADNGGSSQFYRQCFNFAVSELTREASSDLWQSCGVLQLIKDDRSRSRWQSLRSRPHSDYIFEVLDADAASTRAGVRLREGGLFFRGAGFVLPSTWCRHLLQHPDIQVVGNTAVDTVRPHGDGWQVTANSDSETGCREFFADLIVLANGNHNALLNLNYAPCMPVAGQTSRVAANPVSGNLSCVLDHSGYVLPAIDGWHTIGSTYDRDSYATKPCKEADRRNLLQQVQNLPGVFSRHDDIGDHHAATRFVSPDRYPFAGPVIDESYCAEVYGDLGHGRHWKTYPTARFIPGLYLLTALGSRGFTTAALCAEVLASQICGEPVPVPASIVENTHPARYLIRALRKNATT
ncbi:MAG: bifunctional tRNA (5-methylaminomethyl-2-thiouridine)(34)-methyltransferase MnmD/FAD-dependent 5-carboxymethylaminomethyl-2-thiouridine(34) oxidoreductase MnmC [Pseudomonadota bacterium]